MEREKEWWRDIDGESDGEKERDQEGDMERE